MKKFTFSTTEEYYREAVRYFRNAKKELKCAKIAYDCYQDLKPVRKACGTCYLAVLLAVDGYLIQRGLDKDKLPISIDEYQSKLNKYLAYNGKIFYAFGTVYKLLHVWGYYRGIEDTKVVKEGFEKAKLVIETITKTKI